MGRGEGASILGRGSKKWKGREVKLSHDGFMSKGNFLLNARFPQNPLLGLRSFPWWIKQIACDQWKPAYCSPVKCFVSGCGLFHHKITA